jgi:hypothetical protein
MATPLPFNTNFTMKNIYFSTAFCILFVSSVFGQFENEKYFLDVNHFENLYDDFSWIDSTDQNAYEDTDKTKYLIVELTLLHTPYLGDKEYVMFRKFGFNSELAYFNLEGEFQRITLVKNKANVKSKYELYDIVEYLNWRFGSHSYSNGLYIYENEFITVKTALDNDGNLLVQSQPKQ